MFSYQFYVVAHVIGIMTLFSALGAAGIVNFLDIPRENNRARKVIAILHGVALLLIFVAGFGLMARIGMMHGASWPLWLIAKLGIWLLMGAAIVFLNRARGLGLPGLLLTIALGGTAAYMAKYKPGGMTVAAPTPAATVDAATEGAATLE